MAKNPEAGAAAALVEIMSEDGTLMSGGSILERYTSVGSLGEEVVQGDGTSSLDTLAEVCVARLAVEYVGKSDPGGRRTVGKYWSKSI